MTSETTSPAGFSDDDNMTTSNLTALLANGSTSLINNTLTRQGEANTILAEQTIKIIYLIIGRFFLRIAGVCVLCATLNDDHAAEAPCGLRGCKN